VDKQIDGSRIDERKQMNEFALNTFVSACGFYEELCDAGYRTWFSTHRWTELRVNSSIPFWHTY